MITKNIVYNIIISLFVYIGIYNLIACDSETSTSEQSDSLTQSLISNSDSSSTTSFKITEDIGETTLIEKSICGDCVLNDNEECDWCSHEPKIGISSCRTNDYNEYIKSCFINIRPAWFPISTLLKGMSTLEFDKEEADLLCKIYGRRVDMESTDYQLNDTLNTSYNLITTEKINDQSYLLQTKEIYNGSIWFTKYEDIPENMLNVGFLSPISCNKI